MGAFKTAFLVFTVLVINHDDSSKKNGEQSFSSKAIGIILMIVIIPLVFYSNTAFTEEILAVDIATFMIAVITGQVVSYSLYKQENRSMLTEVVAIAVITLLAIIFITFTFYRSHLPIFMDSENYGI